MYRRVGTRFPFTTHDTTQKKKNLKKIKNKKKKLPKKFGLKKIKQVPRNV